MILSDLITACERGFSSVSTDSKAQGIEISSGGNDVPGDANLRTEPAALYATEALAFSAWLDEFNRVIWLNGNETGDERKAQSLVWVERPYVETYRITLGDAYGSYRVVRDRYVVRGTVAVEPARPVDTHDYALNDMICVRCGTNRNEVLDNLKPGVCSGEADVPLPEEVLKPKRKAKAA